MIKFLNDENYISDAYVDGYEVVFEHNLNGKNFRTRLLDEDKDGFHPVLADFTKYLEDPMHDLKYRHMGVEIL